MLTRDISRDGPGQSKTSKGNKKANSIWTLRTLDGKLFVFNNGKPVSTPPDEATGGQLHHSKDTETVIDSVSLHINILCIVAADIISGHICMCMCI